MNDDLSNIFEKLNINKDAISPEMINNLMNMLNKNESSQDKSQENFQDNSFDFDMDTILKIKSIIDKMNTKSSSPSLKLLNDLKPFLSESKQNKLEQYIKIDKIIELLPLIGGDLNLVTISDDKALLFSLIAILF